MARDLTAAVTAAAAAEVVRPVIILDIDLSTGSIRLNSSDRDLTWNGKAYYGVGYHGAISSVEESSELQAANVSMTLSGIPTKFVTTVTDENYQGRPVTIWQGFLNDSYTLIADPIVQFAGLIDQLSLVLGQTATVTLTAEHKLARWERPNSRRYTDADQQAAYSGDLGCQFISQVVEKEILWGRTA